MFLFLDVVSPIPEFHLIKDKKIIVSIKITENSNKAPGIPAYNIKKPTKFLEE